MPRIKDQVFLEKQPKILLSFPLKLFSEVKGFTSFNKVTFLMFCMFKLLFKPGRFADHKLLSFLELLYSDSTLINRHRSDFVHWPLISFLGADFYLLFTIHHTGFA